MHTFEYSFESNFGQEEGVAHLRTGRNMTSLPYIMPSCQWEKIERRLFWTKTIRNTLKRRVTDRIDTLTRAPLGGVFEHPP